MVYMENVKARALGRMTQIDNGVGLYRPFTIVIVKRD